MNQTTVPLLTLGGAAKRLNVSVSTVRNLARAAELAAAGKQPHEVARRIRPFLNAGFPVPAQLGGSRRLQRIDERELEAWRMRQCPATRVFAGAAG